MKSIDIPIALGPGSQPAEKDGAEMDFMTMPSGMSTFAAPMVPQPEDAVGQEAALEVANQVLQALRNFQAGDHSKVFDISRLNDSNRDFIDQLLGEGEVSVQCSGELQAVIQESVLAGVWRVQYTDGDETVLRDTIEVGEIPSLVADLTFQQASDSIDPASMDIPDDIYNAAPLLTEIADQLNAPSADEKHHIINLSLLHPPGVFGRGAADAAVTVTARQDDDRSDSQRIGQKCQIAFGVWQ